MWVAALVVVLGLLAVALVTQWHGYRLGGVITVPVLAVYSLKEFVMLPVFLLSAVTASVGLWLLRRYTLVYGREELVAAILIGTLVPLVTLLFVLGLERDVQAVAFVGSILPGLAAYNYHRLDPGDRRRDVLWSAGLLVALLALGWVLVRPWFAARFGSVTPVVLFAPTADVAVLNGATGVGTTNPVILPRSVAASLFAGGLVVAEVFRQRYAVRIGVIAAVLLAVYAVASYWLVVAYLLMYGLSLAFVVAVNHFTLRYGRVLLGVAVAFAVAVVVPVTLALPVSRGLSAVFVAVLAAVTAYNTHATAPLDRRLVLPLQVAVFVPALGVARLFAEPSPTGIPGELTPPVVAVGALLLVGSVGLARYYTVSLPDESEVLAASVLSEGEGT